MKDLTLINPSDADKLYGDLKSLVTLEPPVWAAMLASFIRDKGYSVSIVDEQIGQHVTENSRLYGVVVLGSNPSASSTPKMMAAIRTAKSLEGNVVLIGLHPSALPKLTFQESYVGVCVGEGFYTLLDILERKKEPRGLYPQPSAELMGEFPIPSWDLLPMENYRAHNWHCLHDLDSRNPYAVIYTSFGCPYNCSYCNIHALYNGSRIVRYRPIGNVLNEFDYLASLGIKNVKIADELFTINKDRVKEICRLLAAKKYDFNLWAYARVGTIDEQLLNYMKIAGINWIAYGFESMIPSVRDDMGKSYSTEDISNTVKWTKDAGINILGNFIFGLPEDTNVTMMATLYAAKALKLDYVNFYTAMAYPGSKLYYEAIKNGVKLPSSWRGYGQFSPECIPMPTKTLTGDEVLKFRDFAFKDFFGDRQYLKLIEEKFGIKARNHIEEMLSKDVERQ